MKIIKIEHFENKGEYGVVHVLLNDGTEAEVWVGGEVVVYYHKNRVKAFIKRRKTLDIS